MCLGARLAPPTRSMGLVASALNFTLALFMLLAAAAATHA
jgi:hypothetical protein